MDIQEIVATGSRAQLLLYSVVKEHPDLALKQIETISNFKSIHSLLAHSIGAELRWQARLNHLEASNPYEVTPPDNAVALELDWQSTRDTTQEFMRKGGNELLNEVFDIHMTKSNYRVNMTGEQIIYQIISHEAFHRAQCSYLLQMFGVDPPNFDFPLML